VLRELLSVLLEVRAHAEAHGALDARVATLERLPARGAVARFQPAAAARERALTLLDLTPDALDKVVTYLAPDDELAASLACSKLRDALRARAQPQRRRQLTTSVRSLLGSLGKLQWGVACAGAPLSKQLVEHVAGLGDLRMLSWLRARGCPWPDEDEVELDRDDFIVHWAVRGARRQLRVGTSRCCAGCTPLAAWGRMRRARAQLRAVTWPCYSGRAPTAVRWTRTRACVTVTQLRPGGACLAALP
jgi:hypothetical protein